MIPITMIYMILIYWYPNWYFDDHHGDTIPLKISQNSRTIWAVFEIPLPFHWILVENGIPHSWIITIPNKSLYIYIKARFSSPNILQLINQPGNHHLYQWYIMIYIYILFIILDDQKLCSFSSPNFHHPPTFLGFDHPPPRVRPVAGTRHTAALRAGPGKHGFHQGG